MFIAPGKHRHNDRKKVAAFLSKHVLVPLRLLVIEAAFEKALRGQMFQAAGKDIRGNSQTSLEFVEASTALERVTQNQNAPPFANRLERPGSGALRAGLLPWLHQR